MKAILLTILITIIFFGGAYFMGNYLLDTFSDGIVRQIMSSLFGLQAWIVIIAFYVEIYTVYTEIEHENKNPNKERSK